MSIMISPSFADTKFDNPTIDDLVDVFEDRIRLWLLEPAKTLMSTEHGRIGGFVMILTYFEGISTYLEGRGSKGRSRECFKNGFVAVFQGTTLKEALLRRVADILYTDARCGFFHDGMFRERIYFTTLPQAEMQVTLPMERGQIDEDGQIQSLLIDSQRFFSAIERHFNSFIFVLRHAKHASALEKFRTAFKEQCDWESHGPIIGIPDPAKSAT